MKAALVIMAAGLGARYGGTKQIDGIGPHNEFLMEYAIYDAIQAGFHKIVLIIKPEMEELIDRICGEYLSRRKSEDGTPIEVAYAFQDFSSLPDFYTIPDGRTKPFGTVHALLCAADIVQEPFCVINADDYYGADAYQTMYQALKTLPESGQAVMVGYLLKNTASLYGAVTRGICTVKQDQLQDIQETHEIQLYPDGTLKNLKTGALLLPESVVSMNFWGFAPSIFPVLQDYFSDFLRSPAGTELKSECLLPVMVGDLLQQHALKVSVLHSSDKWFGMTYHEDRKIVAQELQALHAANVYPESLRV